MRIHINGVSLFFDTEGPSLEQRGTTLHERPTVVAIHGGPGIDHAMYRPTLSALARTAQVVYPLPARTTVREYTVQEIATWREPSAAMLARYERAWGFAT